MDDRRCPFCGGMLLDKICVDCGFECLTEEEIAAPYDFVPDNDAFGDPEEAQNTGMEGISLASLDGSDVSYGMPSIGVQPAPQTANRTAPQTANHTAAYTANATSSGSYNSPLTGSYNSPQTGSRNAAPQFRTNSPQQNTPVQNYTPPPMPAQQNMSVFEMIVKDLSNYIQKYWWQILLTFIAPTTGLFFGIYYFSKLKRGGTATDVALGIIYTLAFIMLKASGFDLFGIDAILWKILEALPGRRRRYRYRY